MAFLLDASPPQVQGVTVLGCAPQGYASKWNQRVTTVISRICFRTSSALPALSRASHSRSMVSESTSPGGEPLSDVDRPWALRNDSTASTVSCEYKKESGVRSSVS